MKSFSVARVAEVRVVGLYCGYKELVTTSGSSPDWTGVAKMNPRISCSVVHHVLDRGIVGVVVKVVGGCWIVKMGDDFITMLANISVAISSSELDGHGAGDVELRWEIGKDELRGE